MQMMGVSNIRSITYRPRHLGIASTAVIGAIIFFAFWNFETIKTWLESTWENTLSGVGLGLIPIVIWLIAFVFSLVCRRHWLKHYRLWISSMVYVGFSMSAMSLFRPFDGPLALFTLDGEVTLGGDWGATIAGSNNISATLRTLAILVLGMIIAFPRLSLLTSLRTARLAVGLYVLSLVIIRGTFVGFMKIASWWKEKKLEQREVQDYEEASARNRSLRSALAEGTGPISPTSTSYGTIGDLTLSDPVKEKSASQSVDQNILTDEKSVGFDDPADFSRNEKTEDEFGDKLHTRTRFNKFWASQPTPAKTQYPVEKTSSSDTSPTWSLPPVDALVDSQEGGISKEQISATGETIQKTLAEYDVDVGIGQTRPGPTVTMYGLTPGWIRKYKQIKITDDAGNPKLDESGKQLVSKIEAKTRVKVDSILSREKDLALALGTPSIRIETPAMGKSLIGIEVPNPSPNLVTLRGVMESIEFKKLQSTAAIPIALGKGSGGQTVVVDLAEMPHLLVAGSTGSGKSVCLNTIVSCLLMKNTPSELRLLLIDPKRVELTPYNGVPHLLTPVVVETDQVVSLLKGLIREMLSRYRRMEEVGARNIAAFNTKMSETMPYLVVAIDELADLMMSASFDVEQSLCRLAQLGRATGIHLIVATQRPSVDVLTGLIKANFPSRVSFAVTSQIDSRTILDTVGAEKLLGKGDMLYQAIDASKPERVQGVYISDEEIETLVGFWHKTPRGHLAEISLHAVGDSEEDDGNQNTTTRKNLKDELMDTAVELAHRHKKLSTSLLQRRMRIGYPRAARLMDQLEEAGIVGPSDGSKSREVIVGKD